MVLQERGCESLPILTEMNPRDHVNSISTIVEADTTPVCRIGSTRYTVLAQQNSKLIFKPRQATVPFPSRLYDDFMCERKGAYGVKDLDAYSIRTTLRNDSFPKKKKDLGSFTLPYYINIVCFEKALTHLGASVSVMPLSTYLNLGLGELAHTKLTVELTDRILKHPKGIAKNVLVGIGKFVFLIDFIILDMPEDVNVPLILGRSFLSTAHAKVDVLIKRDYMLSLRERMELDLKARLIGETLILNRSLDLLNGDYIKLNDLNEPLELRRNQVDDLEPTIEEGKVVNNPMIDIAKARSDFTCCRKENIDPYLDEGMGDVIVGEPFCKASCVEAKRFDGIITIHDGDNSVTLPNGAGKFKAFQQLRTKGSAYKNINLRDS
ncbi:ribonuclease H-like domain-containing protein [Tanacetum coccineum]